MKISFNKKTKQRVVSFTTAFAMIMNIFPMGELSNVISPLFSINASAEEYTPQSADASVFSGNSISFSNTVDFVDYCWHYYNNTTISVTNPDETVSYVGFAEYHQNDILTIGFTGGGEISTNFTGLGSYNYPFGGTLRFGGENYQLNAHRALFNYVYDSVGLLVDATGATENLVIKRLSDVGSSESRPLLADHVRHDTRKGKTTAEWQIELNSSNSNTYSGVIGETESNAAVKLNYTNSSSADIESASDVGEICGTMQSGSSIELTYSAESDHDITSSGGNAGGLVGTMNGSSTLAIKAMPSVSLNAESTSAYAGGLVGELTSQVTIDNQTGSVIPVSGSIKGVSGAGGLFGHYTNYKTEFDLKDYNNTATVDGTYCGGVFGVLENNKDDSATSLSLTIQNTSNAGILMANSGTTGNASGYYGGIAGKYTTNALANSLILDDLTLTANANAAYSAFGGAIGTADSASYIQTTNTVSVTASGTTSSTYFGGLVGATSADNGVFVDLGSFTLNTGSEQFNGGGVVGLFKNGVLRLSGTTTMTNAKPASAANCGQLVGNNDNVLVYAPSGGSWSFSRSSGAKTDDLGTWGEVVRGVDDSSSSNAIYFNNTDHTATVAAAETSMGSADDFIRTALNIQLNQGSNYDCLLFTSGSANTRDTLLTSANLSLSADISLAGTGIMGFMRDGGAVANIGVFTGTFDGNDHTITLAIGEKYGSGITSTSTGEGIGQIYRHQHNGLFSVLAGTVQNLTVDGTINVSNCVDRMNIGGIASRNSGNITLTKVAANETVNYNESSKVDVSGEGKNIGGYIGYVGTNGNIIINGVSSIGAKFNLSGSHESWNVYGGAIGKMTAGTFTVNIGTADDAANKLTDSLTTDITGITAVGSNGDGGGLIGHITSAGSYATRQVNINNLAISSCTVGNAASSTGGGFLGYSWLNTTTTIDGLTASGTINNTAATKTAGNVGVLLYSSTGKMIVNSLTINGLTMSSGGGSSLGMIVNRAFVGETKDGKTTYSGGLYLDVLNSGYSLTCTAPPSATGVFDEIAAYSAMNASEVVKGGAGVISINMNGGRHDPDANPADTYTETKVTVTGTYQNRLKTSDACANPNSRYYYNIDNMSSSDAGQNLLLWSLSKYAYSGIKSEFGTTFNTTLSGTADMTGLSFYPLASANENYSIGNLTLTFDYSGIYSTAETVSNGDGYIRDPAVANQHYLMHSGLFIDQPSGKSLTVTGTLSLGGTFMEDSNHQGVLISGTMEGTFLCDIGSIILDGIKPMSGSSAYTSGYLLINNISRTDDLATPPSVTIKNLSNTDKYSSTTGSTYSASGTTDNVAKSLIGTASGKGLTIIFSKIKLDGRDKIKSDTNLNAEELYNAYKTYNSIFSQSTLLASIHTDQSAKLEYNFTKAHDWGTNSPREVTYGAEIKNSLEYVDEEQRYSPDSNGSNADFVNPVNSSTRSEVYNFATGFLPYVKVSYNDTTDANGCFKRELKVNVQSVALSSGCGTYNDPYLISDPKVFEAIAKFIASGDTTDLKEVVLPKSPDSDDIISGNRWHDGTDYHATFKASGTNYISGSNTWSGDNVRKYLASAYYKITADIELTNSYVGLGWASESDSTANGNYAFRGVIVGADVPDSSAKNAPTHKARITNGSANPFINVSNGSVIKDLNIIVSTNISLSQENAAYNNAFFGYYHQCKYYGGIIGEVMGGDNIIDNSYVTYSNSKITLSGGKATIVPVGGYVGVVVFGGVIFKNMTATTSATSTELKVNNSGINVIYTGKTENLADNNKQDDWAAIYVNPIVGRVINGYAINETTQFSTSENGKYHDDAGFNTGTTRANTVIHTLKNGSKHYSIADINKNETNKLNVSAVPASASSDGTINIPNSQAFFILSLITQSCAGTAQGASGDYVNSLSYGTNTSVYGMSRNADYTNVGSAADSTDTDFVLASNDTTANSATPYIIDRYCANHNARCVTSTKGYYDINLTGKATYSVDSYTYQLPDSFRGLGSVGNYDYKNCGEESDKPSGQNITVSHSKYPDRVLNPFCIKLDVFNGNGCTIDEDIYLNKFQSDNYFNILHEGVDQSVQSHTAAYNGNKRTLTHGIGLFDSIIMNGENSKIENFTVTGSVNTEIYNNTYKTTKKDQLIKNINNGNYWLSVGGVLGWATNATCLNFSKIHLDNLTVTGSSTVGGILGFSGLSSTTLNVVISECDATDISVEMSSAYTNENNEKARNGLGCFVGKTYESAVVIYGTSSGADNSNIENYSEVKISSYKFGNSTDNFTVSAGGLVGFAGNGCRVYDMKLTPYNNSVVTIGGTKDKIRYVGGIVGLMQPTKQNETSCLGIFKNCTVEEINLQGIHAGGLYGGKWNGSGYSPYKIEIYNCKMLGDSTNKNTIIANDNAGGLIGWGIVQTRTGNEANIIIEDSLVSNYNIYATAGKYSGGFIGFCQAQAQSITCYIRNSSVENCIIGQSGTNKDYAGGIIGGIAKHNDNKIIGYNIKLDTVTSPSTNRKGAWIGNVVSDDNKTSIQFSGMAVYDCNFTQNVGNRTNFSNASFVFADYMGKCNGTQTTDPDTNETSIDYPTDISGFNYSASTHVEMPKYPYVNINPQSDIGANEIISGDGAALYGSSVTGFSGKTADKTMAAKIYADLSDTTNTRRYTTFDKTAVIYGSKTIEDYLKVSPGTDGDKISTYRIEKGGLPTGVEDFAVIVIANQTTDETTNLINNYIRLVTNTSIDYTTSSDYYSINIQTCKFNGTDFVIDNTATNHGLTFSGGKFDLNGSYADSNNTTDTFTLVDVQFKDPFNTSKIAYHLYVPVYTIKQIEVDFRSAVRTGTYSVKDNSGTNDYSSLMTANGKHVDSLETWITQYIRYSYKAEDINMLLNSNNVKWNNDKKVIFRTFELSTTFNRLPQNTYMVLVDPNGNVDREYYAKNLNDFETYYDTNHDNKEGWVIDLSKFKDRNNNTFTVSKFNALIARNIVESTTGDLLYTDGSASDYDVYRIQGDQVKYYKYANGTTGKYHLSVADDYILNEDYYISMYVPKSSALYFYEIKAPSELTGTKTAKVNEKNVYTVIAADLYTQDTTSRLSVSPEDQQINASNKTIYVNASTSITINNTYARTYLNGVDLYHSFDLKLNRHTETDVLNDIIGLGDSNDTSKITATYSIGSQADESCSSVRNKDLQANYLNIETAEIMSDLITASTNGQPLVVYSYIAMNFDENKLEAEFPQKSSEGTIGVNVSVTSNLAYDESRLAYTSMSAPFATDGHYYYREAVNSAKLDYTAVTELDEYDKIGKMSQNQSRIGVNGYKTDCYQQHYMPINTEAKYNVSAISETDLSKAETLRLTISLSKKTDNLENGVVTSVEYSQVSDLLKYLDKDILITSGSRYGTGGTGVTHTISANSSSLVVDIPFDQCFEEDNIYTIGVDFSAKTGTGFYEYANYMVTLRTELIYTDEQSNVKAVENSGISDYVVYTNAKVFPTLISNAS